MLNNFIKANRELFAALSPLEVAATLKKISKTKSSILDINGLIVMFDGYAIYNKDGKIVDMITPPKESTLVYTNFFNKEIVDEYANNSVYILRDKAMVHENRTVLPIYDSLADEFTFDGADYERTGNVYEVTVGSISKNYLCELRGNVITITEVVGAKNNVENLTV